MPDTNGTDRRQAAPPALPADDNKVKLPPTDADRVQARLAMAAQEDDGSRSTRRTKEFQAHLDAHMERVAEAHKMFSAPLHRNWDDYTDEEKKNWNLRGEKIAEANRTYHLAVKRSFAEHQAEDRHIGKLRDEAAKKAQETV